MRAKTQRAARLDAARTFKTGVGDASVRSAAADDAGAGLVLDRGIIDRLAARRLVLERGRDGRVALDELKHG